MDDVRRFLIEHNKRERDKKEVKNEGEEEKPQYMCRICFEEEPNDSNLIIPCRCSGTSIYIHRRCLDTWRNTSTNNMDKCNTCKFPYVIEKVRDPREKEKTIKHTFNVILTIIIFIVIFLVIFIVLFCIAAYILGGGKRDKKWGITLYLIFASIFLFIIITLFDWRNNYTPQLGDLYTMGTTFIIVSILNTFASITNHINTKIEASRRALWGDMTQLRRVKDFKGRLHEIPDPLDEQEQ